MTPFQFLSELSLKQYKAMELNATGNPRPGSVTGSSNTLDSGNGLSFSLKTTLNPYTKVTTESQKHAFIELLVAMFSVLGKESCARFDELGSLSVADKVKSVVEVTHTEIKTQKKKRRLRKQTLAASFSTSSTDSVTQPLLDSTN